MAKRMLINASHQEECRVAIAEDDKLLELEYERADQEQQKGNIYKATISRIEPSLQAAFLDIGSSRNGFLQINDIHPAYFKNWPPENVNGKLPRPSIQDVLRAGQNLIVQVVKDERDAKGATLTTNLSIPGRYLVLMVGNQRGGVSRKIVDSGQRNRLREAVQSLKVPPGMSVIVRTAGIDKTGPELQADLDNLLNTWNDIVKTSLESKKTPKPLYLESDLATRTIRDYVTAEFDEILIDEKSCFERAQQFMSKAMPQLVSKLVYYDGTRPLFSNYHLDTEVEEIESPEVTLPSGGSIVINTTEAVVAIDVNSGRATAQADVEETAFATNKEAATCIAKQLRLRDLGGLIVIDFIDMSDKRHKQTVEKVLKDAVSGDKAKVELARISKFGLLEMSRQRLKTSLASKSYQICQHCDGRGRVKTTETAALEALRKIESVVHAGGIVGIRVRLAPAAALFLLNKKRKLLTDLEESTGVTVFVYADGRMKQHEYELELDSGKKEPVLASGSRSLSERLRSEARTNEAHAETNQKPKRGRGGRSKGSGTGRRGSSKSRGRGTRRQPRGGKEAAEPNESSEQNKEEKSREPKASQQPAVEEVSS